MVTDVEILRADIERPEGGIGYPRTLRLLVESKNINEDTLLATDYLNHFNEIVMLLELVADMPECLEDALEWKPKSYADHFNESSFQNRALAVFAYENAPRRYREPFDQLVTQMDATVIAALKGLSAAVELGDAQKTLLVATRVTAKLQRFVDVASAVIHGRVETSGQAEIDILLSEIDDDAAALETPPPQGDAPAPPTADDDVASQTDLDALFG